MPAGDTVIVFLLRLLKADGGFPRIRPTNHGARPVAATRGAADQQGQQNVYCDLGHLVNGDRKSDSAPIIWIPRHPQPLRKWRCSSTSASLTLPPQGSVRAWRPDCLRRPADQTVTDPSAAAPNLGNEMYLAAESSASSKKTTSQIWTPTPRPEGVPIAALEPPQNSSRSGPRQPLALAGHGDRQEADRQDPSHLCPRGQGETDRHAHHRRPGMCSAYRCPPRLCCPPASQAPWPPMGPVTAIRKLRIAWVLTLPAAILLSGHIGWSYTGLKRVTASPANGACREMRQSP